MDREHRERAALWQWDIMQRYAWGMLLVILIVGSVLTIGRYPSSGERERPGPLPANVNEIEQVGFATDRGISVTAVVAGFDEKASYVLVRFGIDNTGTVESVAGSGFDRQGLAPAGFEGPLATGEPQVDIQPDGSVLLRFPPFEPGPSYNGTIPFTITAIDVATQDGAVRIDGDWSLLLRGPSVQNQPPPSSG
jgi:hypothetical protein